MKVPVDWNDAKYIWNGDEDFIWEDAYRIVQEVLGSPGDWTVLSSLEDLKKKKPQLAEKFIDVVIKVNGLSQSFKKQRGEKPVITIDHVQKTFREFGLDRITVKAEIKKP